jgi:pseudouridine synthase
MVGSNKHLGQLWHAQRDMGLGRALQKAGYGTRKATEAMVVDGRVKVGGKIVSDPKSMVGPTSEIVLDNHPLRQVRRVYLVLNKPMRVVCVPSDGAECQLVSEFLPVGVPGLLPVGRMDSRITGLLLVSNDKDWNNALVQSKTLEQEYRVQIEGELTELEIRVMEAGINLPKMGTFKPLSIKVVEMIDGRTVINVVLTDGKVRQLRRMFSTLRHKIFYLRRVREGNLRIGTLAPGKWRYLKDEEILAIRKLAGPEKK